MTNGRPTGIGSETICYFCSRDVRQTVLELSEKQGSGGRGKEAFYLPRPRAFFSSGTLLGEQVLRGALAAEREKEGELARRLRM